MTISRVPVTLAAGGAAILAGQASVMSSGVPGGVQAGCNDVPTFDLFGQSLFGAKPLVGVEADFDGAVRGRIGLTFDRVLVYATGGFADGRVNSSLIASAAGLGTLTASAGAFHTGFAVGGEMPSPIT